MQISGIIEKVYDYDFGTGDISMDILSDGKVIRCTGISGRLCLGRDESSRSSHDKARNATYPQP